MSQSMEILSKLKSAQLKALCLHCGLGLSGTKGLLISNLIEGFNSSEGLINGFKNRNDKRILNSTVKTESNPADSNVKVLSIDMGIRNFSFCLLSIPQNYFCNLHSSNIKPVVQQWRVLDVESEFSSDVGQKGVFEPQNMSIIGYNMVRELFNQNLVNQGDQHIAPSLPDIILIERQRFRTMGGSSIVDWTINVNMLESILHAVLRTLIQEYSLKSQVFSVSPRRVRSYWAPDTKSGGSISAIESNVMSPLSESLGQARAYRKSKKEKLNLVDNWLSTMNLNYKDPHLFSLADQIGELFSLRKAKRVDIFGTKSGKTDDLADSLLQGLAWIRWQKNAINLNNCIDEQEPVDAILEATQIEHEKWLV